LEGTNWVLDSSTALGVPLGDIVVSAEFDRGTVTGSSGCNRYGASYTLAGSKLAIGATAGTLMACGSAENAVERAYLERLAKVAGFNISGSTLTLYDTSSHTLLVFSAASDANALLGNWSVSSYYAVTALTSVVGGVELTAKFDESTVTGSGGCNTFRGPYRVTSPSINIGPITSTFKTCTATEVNHQEQHYLSALQQATTFKVTGPQLILYRSDGGIAVILKRA
jgi:heat shock protein HslJ